MITLIEKLTEDYIKKKCKCIIKGGDEPKLIFTKVSNPYYKSNNNPNLDPIAENLCKNKVFVKQLFNTYVLDKLLKGKINWLNAYFLLSIIN